MEELVSIIVPTFNNEKFIKDTITKVQEQTYKNWEMIFINDASTDNSKYIIEKYIDKDKRIQLINLEQNSGVAIARNKGIEKAKGKYIAFLDADDIWDSIKLEKQIKFMEDNEYAFTYTDYQFVNEQGEKKGKIVEVPKTISYKQALKNTTIFTSTVILNVDRLGKNLIKMPNIRKGQDTATWWQILKTGIIAYGLNECLSMYRRSSNTLSSNKIKALKRTWYLYRNVEKFSVIRSFYYFCWYVLNAIKRRI